MLRTYFYIYNKNNMLIQRSQNQDSTEELAHLNMANVC
jgi:hypothetical protein